MAPAGRWCAGLSFRAARTGIEAAVTLAMGRALGEAIAVSLVIGGGVTVPHSLAANGTTLGSAVINYFGDAVGIQRSAVIGLVLVLFAFTALANIGGQMFLRRRATAHERPRVTLALHLGASA